MERRKKSSATLIDPDRFGISFSVKQCRNFGLKPTKTLAFLLHEMGWRRFRLMSYWNEIEKVKGSYDFKTLDEQVRQITKAGGIISLCLGVRQPRWPESHWPDWALGLPQAERYQALYDFITKVVERYKGEASLISWQLENEALNRSFGLKGDFNRGRLKREYELIRQLDPGRPIIMTTSNTWGIPLRQPRPDQFGFTFYQIQFENSRYSRTKLPAWWWALRARLIKLLSRRPSFIHELQAEPWGPKAIWEMDVTEQNKSMSINQLEKNISLAKRTNLYPIDLWGGEWWYWRHLHDDNTIAASIKSALTT